VRRRAGHPAPHQPGLHVRRGVPRCLRAHHPDLLGQPRWSQARSGHPGRVRRPCCVRESGCEVWLGAAVRCWVDARCQWRGRWSVQQAVHGWRSSSNRAQLYSFALHCSQARQGARDDGLWASWGAGRGQLFEDTRSVPMSGSVHSEVLLHERGHMPAVGRSQDEDVGSTCVSAGQTARFRATEERLRSFVGFLAMVSM